MNRIKAATDLYRTIAVNGHSSNHQNVKNCNETESVFKKLGITLEEKGNKRRIDTILLVCRLGYIDMKSTTSVIDASRPTHAVPNGSEYDRDDVGDESFVSPSRDNSFFAKLVESEPSPLFRNHRLVAAASDGNLEDAREMLKRGADPIAAQYRALRGAALNGHTEIVQELLQAIADPDARRVALDIANTKGLSGMADLSKVLPRGKSL